MNAGRILVVDDDVRHADSLVGVLEANGHQVLRAGSGNDALALLEGSREPPDLILLDLNMPGVDGYEVLARTRSVTPPPKVIVVSGEDRRDALRKLLQLGAFDYLPKPYALEDLLRSVDAAITRQRTEADSAVVLDRIRESDRLHRFLVDQSPDVIYMLDEEARFTFLSASAEQVFQRRREDLIGRHWTLLFDTEQTDVARNHFDERRTGHRATTNLELRLRTPEDAEERWVEVSAIGIHDQDGESGQRFAGTYGVARDISDRKRFSAALARSQRRFETLFHSSPDAIVISDLRDGSILERNAHYVELASRYGAEENDHWLWSDASARAAFIAELRNAGGTVQRDLSCQRSDGQHRVLALSARSLALEARESVMMTLRDVTSDRQREEERMRMENQLQQSRRLEAIGQLAGGIAHDFNNILASMIGFADLARSTSRGDELAPRTREYLDEVVSAGQRARDLIAQLLNFSRTDLGEPVEVDLRQETDAVLRMLRAVIPASIQITHHARGEAPPVLIDPVQLHQVIINLFINARDAIEGEGQIDVSVDEATLTEERSCASCGERFRGDFVCLEVRDDGAGIPEEIRDTLFDRLVTTRTGGRGTGFGLALIHSILHQHGGHVGLKSAPGEGACFQLYLPLSAGTPGQVPEPSLGDTGEHAALGAAGRVVVVDDEVSVANFLSEVLEHAGHDVTVFNDPGTALDYLRGHAAEVDLLITDQTMPKMSGSELARATAGIDAAPPVILCTGYGNALTDTRIPGVQAILSKPFQIQELLDQVAQAIAREITPAGQA